MYILKYLLVSVLLSSSIYFEYFNLTNIYINSITALLSIYFLFTINKNGLFFIGFFTGILWFWWIAYSFIIYNLSYLIPLIIISIGLIYALLFYIIGLNKSIYYKIIIIFLLSFIEPFGFNWFKLELLFVNSIFDISKLDLLCIIIAVGLTIEYKKYYILLLLLIPISYSSVEINKTPMKIYMPQYNINQNIKWNSTYKQDLININLKNIDYAIKNKYDLVILPETIFPFPLNKNKDLLKLLKNKSMDISIIAGALEYEKNKYYNSTYYFNNKKIKIARKVVLVPFGESIPLPKFFVNIINHYLFNDASDYSVSSTPTTFNINNINFRNAICFEATTDIIYNNLDSNYIIVTSNNAWFTPSIEPIIQNLLLQYYAKKYNVIIFHSSNSSKNKIIY
jgi:apolipoprotein N-acyltransferase